MLVWMRTWRFMLANRVNSRPQMRHLCSFTPWRRRECGSIGVRNVVNRRVCLLLTVLVILTSKIPLSSFFIAFNWMFCEGLKVVKDKRVDKRGPKDRILEETVLTQLPKQHAWLVSKLFQQSSVSKMCKGINKNVWHVWQQNDNSV